MILDQAVLFEVASARFVGNLPEDEIAEGEAILWIRFFTERLFKNLSHK